MQIFIVADQPRLCLCLHVLDLFPFFRRVRLFLHRTFLDVVDTVVTVVVGGGDGVVAAPAVFGDGVVFVSVGVVVDDWVPVGGAVVVVGDGVVIVVGVGVDGVGVGGAVAVVVVDGVIVVAGVVAIVLVSTVVAVEITLVDP